jgi:hypothetical protein
VGAAGGRQGNAEQTLQGAAHLAVGEAGLLVQLDHGGLGIGAELGRGSSQGVGRLQRVAALDASPAAAAVADVDVELAVDRPPRDLDLVLSVDVGLLDGAAAVGARAGQRRVAGLGDLLGGRREAVGLGAVVGPRLAAGLPWREQRRPLGEGGGLALSGPALVVEQSGQALHLGAQVIQLPLEPLTARAERFGHAVSIGSYGAGSRSRLRPTGRALSQYQ